MTIFSATISLSSEGYQQAIERRIGAVDVVHIDWEPRNWVRMRASQPWVYRDGEINDGDHILLFPQAPSGLCPPSWLEVAWPFLERFRSYISFYPQAAAIYRYVTLIGRPLDQQLGISTEVEDALKRNEWRRVERILCRDADQLGFILRRRLMEGVPFRGRDEGVEDTP